MLAKFLFSAAILPEELPDGHAGAVEGAVAGELESVAVLRVDEGGGEVVHEVAFDSGALRGEVREVGGTLEDGAFGEAQVDLRFEEESTGDEDTLGDDNGASALGGKLIDGSLDGLGVDGGVVGDRAGLGNEELASGRGEGFRGERPEWSRGDEGVEAAAGVALDRHQQILRTGAGQSHLRSGF